MSEPAESTASLRQRYHRVRAVTEAACAPLSPEDMVIQSMPDASPTKWHLAHTSWFFETFVLATTRGYQPFHPDFNFLFNSYYEAVGERHPRPRRGMITRPDTAEVYRYRAHVDAAMNRLLAEDQHDLEALRPIIELGLNHEQQHLELIFTDIKHALAQNPLRPAYASLPPPASNTVAPPTCWLTFDAGIYEIGHGSDGFAFDNEGPRHRVFLESFAIASRPISCGEFLEFINDNGYARPELWLSDGWAAVRAHGWESPAYWERHDGCWMEFTLGGRRPLEMAAPVAHVSYYEADAYARWAGARLPTEAEWEVACPPLADGDGDPFAQPRLQPAAMIEDGQWPASVLSDVWEWTQSPYTPYPGFRPATGALGEYNGKFMCNQMVLRGGSCVTPPNHRRATYRNFFPPEARWQFTGLRLAQTR